MGWPWVNYQQCEDHVIVRLEIWNCCELMNIFPYKHSHVDNVFIGMNINCSSLLITHNSLLVFLFEVIQISLMYEELKDHILNMRSSCLILCFMKIS